ncbi:hypothetical protein BXT89_03115 [Halopseudomonas pachastrellae]|uniref:Uncharacterized protein n=1 Tax=Halopseudomonas pachastrellae TaxID=254161 RepID=A0A1S8DKK0_9GAMM|nr:hypothetical protein [Halopseudomonas pachastrellae]ONM45429.1 hypothetical protein BXT89_03115 [Halopseudomonas pachastrellae]SFL72139.1 hypothetical protein SAMN05216256_101132 [Halopseudomonas pachastrellae]
MVGLTDIGNMEQTKRRATGVPLRLDDTSTLPAGIARNPTPSRAASNPLAQMPSAKPDPLAGYQQNVQRNRQALSNAAGAAADLYKGAASTLLSAATVVPRTVGGIASGETPITIDSNLPDYGAGERQRAEQKAQRRAERAASVPMQGQEFARGVADRAVSRATSALASIPKPATPSASGQGGSASAPASTAPAAQEQSAAVSLTEPPAGSWASVGNGVAGRRNAQGVAEFTDRPEALAGAQPGRVGGLGDGIGGLSVVSGGREAMDRNLLATEIMQQTRRERSNPNYLTVVGDSSRERAATRNPLDRLVNDRANQERADARAGRENARLDRLAGGNQRIAQLQGQLEQSAQARIDNERNNRAATRLDDLSSILADPSLSPERRAQIERTMGSLTVSAKDRYVPQDVVMGYDETNKPILGRSALDVLTGQTLAQPATLPRTSVPMSDVIKTANARNLTTEQVIEMLAGRGIGVDQ